MLNAREVIADRFEVRHLAGAGGMGHVYQAVDRLDGQPVALKIMARDANAARFAREARLLSELNHPGIVRYIAHGTEGDHLYIAMEWVSGETLSARLKRAPLSDADSLELVRRVADALALAHSRRVVHRDIKPANLLLVDGQVGRTKVLDFGIAHLGDVSVGMTRTGSVLGTVGYMAPEQAKGARRVDPCADVFALGAVWFHCLTGRPPFAGGPQIAVLAKLVLEDAPDLRSIRPELPQEVCDVVRRMLSKEPTARPRDGAALLDAIRGLEVEGASGRPNEASGVEDVLTDTEQRLVCVLLARAVPEAETIAAGPLEAADGESAVRTGSDAPSRVVHAGASSRALRDTAAKYGARLEPLRSGDLAVLLSGSSGPLGGTATDLANRAARCGLALRALLPDAPMALATGRGVVAGPVPVGEVIERAASMLASAPTGCGICVDSVSASFLEGRFDLDNLGAATQLISGERPRGEAARKLLGRPTTTVGRDRDLGFLESMFDECVAEPVARLALVTGVAGIGKSRVRYELLRRLAGREINLELLVSRGDPVAAGSPFGLLAQAIRRAAGVVDGEPAGRSGDRLRDRVARCVPTEERERVAAFLGEIARIPFDESDNPQLAAARCDPMLMGDQMRRAWVDFVVGECRAHPVLWVVEDLHWGDLPTVNVIETTLRMARELPLMVLCLARPEARQQFPTLWQLRDMSELRLGGLTRKACEKLAREVLGEAADADRIRSVADRADGNAFYLEELIRSVAEGDDALPESVLAMVHSRLEVLPDAARRLLRAASIFGGAFWEDGVSALIGGDANETEIADWLETLSERELITKRLQSRFPGTLEYVFRHALLQEAAYGMLTSEDRARGHRLAGSWLENNGEPDAIVLAQHYEQGELADRALFWCQLAAEEALEANDLEGALSAARRALGFLAELPDAGDVRGKLRRLEGEALYWLAKHPEAQAAAQDAMNALDPGSSEWLKAVALLTLAAHRAGDVDCERACARLLLDGGWCDLDTPATLICCNRVAVAMLQLGEYELAEEMFTHLGRGASTQTDDPGMRARWQASLAARALFRGKTFSYWRLSQAAASSSEQAGDLRAAAVHRHNCGHASMVLGAYDDAERALREAVAIGERLGLANLIASATNNLAATLTRTGRLDEARPLLDTAIAMLGAQGDRRMEAGARNHLAELLLAQGDAPSAVHEAKVASDISEHVPALRLQAMGTLARAHLEEGSTVRALALVRELQEQMERISTIADGEASVQLAMIETLAASGDALAARAVLERAKGRLLERAAEVDEPALRRAFLEGVAEHARILALARKEDAGAED